jgi:hypothetical protein
LVSWAVVWIKIASVQSSFKKACSNIFPPFIDTSYQALFNIYMCVVVNALIIKWYVQSHG